MRLNPVTLAIIHADKIGLDIFPITTIKGKNFSHVENALALVGFKSIEAAYKTTYNIQGKIHLFKSSTDNHLIDMGGTEHALKFLRQVSYGKMNHVRENHVWMIGIRVDDTFAISEN